MSNLELYILKSNFEYLPEEWNLSEYTTINYSQTMRDLYLDDFPNAWKNDETRKRIGTIGANDYFNKWTGTEFMTLEDTALNSIYNLVEEELANGSIIDGKRTGIPLSGGNHQLLFYNKKFVDKIPNTFEELITMSEDIKKEYNLEYSFVFPTGACYFILPMLYGFGADLWSSPDKEPISFDSLYKTIVFLSDLIYNKKVFPVKWEQEDSMKYFMDGKAAFCIGGDWNINEFDNALNHNMGIAEIPKLERECRSNRNANYLYISKDADSEIMKNAVKFCEKVLSEEIQTSIIEKLYRMPALKNYKLDKNKFNEIMIDSNKIYQKSFVLPPSKEVANMYHVLADLLEPNILISDTPENLTKDVLKKIKEVDNYNK